MAFAYTSSFFPLQLQKTASVHSNIKVLKLSKSGYWLASKSDLTLCWHVEMGGKNNQRDQNWHIIPEYSPLSLPQCPATQAFHRSPHWSPKGCPPPLVLWGRVWKIGQSRKQRSGASVSGVRQGAPQIEMFRWRLDLMSFCGPKAWERKMEVSEPII